MTISFDVPDSMSSKEVKAQREAHSDLYSEEKIREIAKVDGLAGIPVLDQQVAAPFESELTFSFEGLASSIAARYKGPLERLDAAIRAENDFVEKEFKTELERIEARYLAEKVSAENAFGIADSHKQLELFETHYHAIRDRLGRGPIEYIPEWLYWVFAFLIFVGEIPLNALVFQIFGENQVMTWVMAFIIGLSIPLTAHFVGVKFREKGAGNALGNFIKGALALAVVTAALYGLSIMRTTYLGEMKEQLGLTEALVQSSFMFFYLNLAVLGAAIMISYLAHDPEPGFQAARDEVERARQQVEEYESQRVYKLKECADTRSEELHKANQAHRDGVSRVINLKGQFDQLLKEGQEQESRCLDRLRRDVSSYRAENLRARESKVMPKSFEVFPLFTLELQKFSEKLHNDA
jgi:hypothetical protein